MNKNIDWFIKSLDVKDFYSAGIAWKNLNSDEIYYVKVMYLALLKLEKVKEFYEDMKIYNERMAFEIFDDVIKGLELKENLKNVIDGFLGQKDLDGKDKKDSYEAIFEELVKYLKLTVKEIDLTLKSMRIENSKETLEDKLRYLSNFKKKAKEDSDFSDIEISEMLIEEIRSLNKTL